MTAPGATVAELTRADLEQLAAAGIGEREARRQLALLAAPPPPARLVRPCWPGDGVVRLEPPRFAELVERGERERNRGRLSKFVPASGAATRMFRALAAVREQGLAGDAAALEAAARGGDTDARETLLFVDRLPSLALARPLAAVLGESVEGLARRARGGGLAEVLAALLDSPGLAAAALPKALLPFHLDGGRTVTAFEEQMVEGIPYLRDREGACRFHLTLPPGSAARFEAELAAARRRLETGGVRLEVTFSEQERATDTLALDAGGRPARSADGSLLLRPSGHGALLANLAATGGDLVVVKNIDNVLPRDRHAEVAAWKLALAGLAAGLAERRDELARELAAGRLTESGVAGAAAWFEATFGRAVAPAGTAGRALAGRLRHALDRPLRVCGVVPAGGEPGGGPFWTAGPDGVTPQIVESSQVEASRRDQQEIWRSSTHFNPVDLVVCLRDEHGRPHDFERFVDPAAAFVTTRSEGGRPLTVLERPGLWNGAMAGWASLFVEVPGATFAPVKSVVDLARGGHAVPT